MNKPAKKSAKILLSAHKSQCAMVLVEMIKPGIRLTDFQWYHVAVEIARIQAGAKTGDHLVPLIIPLATYLNSLK